MKTKRYVVAALVLVLTAFAALGQSRNSRRPPVQKPVSSAPPQQQADQTSPKQELDPAQNDLETLKIDTNLVTVPVIASSRSGKYIADLRKEEFTVSEDGVAQEIAFFATVSAPFHVVLLLDTSASTKEKIGQIQQAAVSFVDQLNATDKVKIISFDDEVRDLNDFTNDKAELRDVIRQARSGQGTKLYDAVQLSLNVLRSINQRKAIVLFTDGVDWYSDRATLAGTVHDLDELGVIVYPIRFDTRADTERMVRDQDAQTNGVQLPTSDVLRKTPTVGTPPTFPSDEPLPGSTRQPQRSSLPSPDVIFGRRRNQPNGLPTDPFPDTTPRSSTPNDPSRVPPGPRRTSDSIGPMLDQMYFTADGYLRDLADRSGGHLYRADTVLLLPQAFAAIAAELQTQYLLGYYPTNQNHDGAYRKIQVKTSRKDVAVRARPGYRVRSGD